ncbi:MAG: NTP transferase domain-containing protein, partial [Akkermansiaceae bacterium]
MKALILTGGKSSRMGQDKADLEIGGQTLLNRAVGHLKDFVQEIYLSIAHDASPSEFDVQRSEFDVHLLPDLEPSPGPLGGLQAAFH